MTGPRRRYLQVLVVLALVMVTTSAAVSRPWLPLVFPAAGVLFTAGAAACVAEVDRGARAFLRRTVLRVLAPLWIFGAVLVPVMLSRGWRADEDLGSAPLTWDTGWLWLLPVSDPPVSTEALEWTSGLWFVRTLLWLTVLTPPLLWLFRRWPLRLTAVPVVTLLLATLGLTGLSGRAYDSVVALCVYGCCWLLGFAYADGTLFRLPAARTLVPGVLLTAAGVWWALTLQAQSAVDDLYDAPPATLMFSAGAGLLLLRAQPVVGRLDGPGRRALAFLPNRMVTVYLWTQVAVLVAPAVLARTPLARFDTASTAGTLLEIGTAALLLLVAAFTLGWVETSRRLGLPWARRRRYVLADNVVRDDVHGLTRR